MSKYQNKLDSFYKEIYKNVPIHKRENEIISNPLIIECIPDFIDLNTMNKMFSLKYDGMPREEFKFVEYENIAKNKYYISSYGRIFNTKGFQLMPFQSKPSNTWYYRIALQCENIINGKIYKCERKFDIHRLVATAFIPKTEEDILLNRDVVNHKYNMDGRCNFVWNLEWTTTSENTIHSINNSDLQLIRNTEKISGYEYLSEQLGESNGRAKYTNNQIDLFCESYYYYGLNIYESMNRAGIECTESNIKSMNVLLQGRTWRSISLDYVINNYNEYNVQFEPVPLVFFD